jgi:hypothetical protein
VTKEMSDPACAVFSSMDTRGVCLPASYELWFKPARLRLDSCFCLGTPSLLPINISEMHFQLPSLRLALPLFVFCKHVLSFLLRFQLLALANNFVATRYSFPHYYSFF